MFRITVGILMIMMITTACAPKNQPDTSSERSIYQGGNERTEFYDSNFGDPSHNGNGPNNKVGYVRYSADNFQNTTNNNGTNNPQGIAYIDRTILAEHIASLVTQLPRVKEATVLVTDDYVFIGVDTPKGKKLDQSTVREARRTAMSATPRFYKIYVTEDSNLRKRIDQLGGQLQNGNNTDGVSVDRNLERLLRDLGDKTPPVKAP